jgi:hypothetical protein
VVGVDLSLKLLEIAEWHERAQPRGIEYLHADARTLEGIAGASFDGVVCSMALMDIADLTPTLHSVARVLRPGGWFVFSILHPCYNTPPSGEMASGQGWVRTISGYWDEGFWRSDARTGPPGRVGAYHRTLSTYVGALIEAGLRLERMTEPRASESVAVRRPVWAEVPAVLVARCSKPAEYVGETAALAGFLCRSLGRIVGCLEGLDVEEQRWRPPALGTNSLLGIAAHALANAQENILGLLGGLAVERDSTAEFDDRRHSAAAIIQQWRELEPRLDKVVRGLSESSLSGQVVHPRRGRLSGFEVLVVALRHAAEHVGEAELTRGLVLARRSRS